MENAERADADVVPHRASGLTDTADSAATAPGGSHGPADRAVVWLLACFTAVHLLFVALDVRYPSAFLRADRAPERLDAILALGQVHGWNDLVSYLGNHGNLGDYAPQAVLYLLGGKPVLVGSQILLMLFSGLCAYRLARMTELSGRASCAAAALYLVSPHSLVFPHQLATEALYVPLLVISTWMTCEAIRRMSSRAMMWSALLLGFATLIRPITLLWPPVIALGLKQIRSRHFAVTFVSAAYLPILVWMAFVWQQTGTFGLGESDHSLSVNLYGRIEAIAAALPVEEKEAITNQYLRGVGRNQFSTPEYFSFALHYPVPFLTYMGRDAIIFLCKSGVERITVDYLANDQQASSLQVPSGDSWRQHLDKYGTLAAVRYGWKVLGVSFLISAATSVLQAVIITLAAIGTVRLIVLAREQTLAAVSRLAGFVVVATPVYIFIFSLVLIATQSRQRAPAEFALAILAVHGCCKQRSNSAIN